jgi:hypothetical protein
MRIPFKCSFCESEFKTFEDYKTHLSHHHPTPSPSLEARVQLSVPRNELKCSSCTWKWLEIRSDSDSFLSSNGGKNVCSNCDPECAKRNGIVTSYYYYFKNMRHMHDIKYKDLYIDCYGNEFHCCLCGTNNTNNNGDLKYYSLAVFNIHCLCTFCFENELESIEYDYYDDKIIDNCECTISYLIDNRYA